MKILSGPLSETIKNALEKLVYWIKVLRSGHQLSPNAEDPFADCHDNADEDDELGALISEVQRDGGCSVQGLIVDECPKLGGSRRRCLGGGTFF